MYDIMRYTIPNANASFPEPRKTVSGLGENAPETSDVVSSSSDLGRCCIPFAHSVRAGETHDLTPQYNALCTYLYTIGTLNTKNVRFHGRK